MLFALLSTEWTFIFVVLSVWAWLRYARYPLDMNTRARLRPAREPHDTQRFRAGVLRFLAPPSALLFGAFTVSVWWDLLSGRRTPSGASVGFVLVSGLLLVLALAMTGQEISLARNGLAMRRPSAKRGNDARRP